MEFFNALVTGLAFLLTALQLYVILPRRIEKVKGRVDEVLHFFGSSVPDKLEMQDRFLRQMAERLSRLEERTKKAETEGSYESRNLG